jgi:hypothetical protein
MLQQSSHELHDRENQARHGRIDVVLTRLQPARQRAVQLPELRGEQLEFFRARQGSVHLDARSGPGAHETKE